MQTLKMRVTQTNLFQLQYQQTINLFLSQIFDTSKKKKQLQSIDSPEFYN